MGGAVCVEKNSEKYAKKQQPRGLSNSIYIVYMCTCNAKKSYKLQLAVVGGGGGYSIY